ncbi:MAG: ZIP family zinc transporter [Armatimonadia bacterium]
MDPLRGGVQLMGSAIVYGLITGLSLLIGAIVGLLFNLSKRATAMWMAFGSGVLICAITFGLMEEAFHLGGFTSALAGFGMGGLVFLLGDYMMHMSGAKRHKSKPLVKEAPPSTGLLISMGAILDGIPESVALGVALFAGKSTGLLMAAAIFLSNLPEGLSSVPGLQREGYSRRKILGIWLAASLLLVVIVIVSYLFLGELHPMVLGFIQAFAAGAILAMLANSMMPEAYDEGGFAITPMTILGFLAAFVIAKWESAI